MSDRYILFMRGLVREKRHWGPHLQLYEKELAPIKPLSLEIPGNGQHYQQNSFTTMEENVEFLRTQLLRQIPKDSQVGIVAYSLGGMIASSWIEKYPQDFKKVMLVNTSFKGMCPVYHRMQISAFLRLLTTRFTKDISEKERIIYKIVSNSPEKEEETVKLWTEIAKSAPVSHANALRQLLAAIKFSPKIEKPNVPVLVVAGKGDRLCNSRCSEKIAAQWGAPLKIHPWGGHELYHDDPQWMVQQLQEWFNDL